MVAKQEDAKETVGSRVLKADRELMEKLAKERRWTLSAYIEWVLSEHLAKVRRAQKKSGT